MQICHLFSTAFWNFWRITRVSTTNYCWVINAQTGPVFFGPPCNFWSPLGLLFTNSYHQSGNPFTPSSSTMNRQTEFGKWGVNKTCNLRTFASYVLRTADDLQGSAGTVMLLSCSARVTYWSVLDNISRVVSALAQLSPSAGTLPLPFSTWTNLLSLLNVSDTWQITHYYKLCQSINQSLLFQAAWPIETQDKTRQTGIDRQQ